MPVINARIFLVAPNFHAAVPSTIYELAKTQLHSEELALRSIGDDAAEQKHHFDELLRNESPAGLILVDIRPSQDVTGFCKKAGIPVVVIDEETNDASCVTTDNQLGGVLAVEHLLNKRSCKKIAVVCGTRAVKGGYNAEQRVRGAQTALGRQNAPLPSSQIFEVVHYSREDGVAVMPKLIDLGVDGIFCAAGDMCASGLIQVARAHQIRIPQQIAVVGYDDALIATITHPTLTTIKQPLKKIAETAVRMITREKEQTLQQTRKVVLNPELIVRESA